MENKDWAYQIIDNDAIKMNNGDNMVDVSTAYLAIDRARSDERHQLLAGWGLQRSQFRRPALLMSFFRQDDPGDRRRPCM